MALKFVHLCDLLEQLETIELRELQRLNRDKRDEHNAALKQWFRNHRTAISNCHSALLSLILPHRRPDRVYHVQEKSLARFLARILRLGSQRVKALRAWTPETDLASLVYRIERETDAGRPSCALTVAQVNDELDCLASLSCFSSNYIPAAGNEEQGRVCVLQRVVQHMRARELKWFIRIVLKRLDPVFLDDGVVLRQVHEMLPVIMRFHADLQTGVHVLRSALDAVPSDLAGDEAAGAVREAVFRRLSPRPGSQLPRAPFFSARSVKHCLQIAGNQRWAVQPKYDGEYCQVHIDIDKGRECIRLFSKSGKESTQDRKGVHGWIKTCLEIGQPQGKIKKNCILEGELVVFNEQTKTILGFNKIRKHVTRGGRRIGTDKDSPSRHWEHLMIIFFDMLLLDDEALMFKSYETRYRALQALILNQSSRVIAPRWAIIEPMRRSRDEVTTQIEGLFVQAISQRCEGLVLKAINAPYFSLDMETGQAGRFNKVIKLKKDKIHGLGDLADFAIIGGYRKAADAMLENLRTLNWTRFTLACLLNKEAMKQHGARPKFMVVGTVGPGCISPRDMKHISNFGQFGSEHLIEGKQPRRFDIEKDMFAEPIRTVFGEPFVAELCGSGFTKPSSQDYYMLRFPRVTKLHNDRSFDDIVSFEELQQLARDAMALPGDVAQEEALWHRRLREQARGKRRQHLDSSPSLPSSSSSSKARTSLMSSVSPLARAPVFVRMDTQEMQPGDDRLVASAAKPVPTCSLQGPLPTPPTSSAIMCHGKRSSDAVECSLSVASKRLRTTPNEDQSKLVSSKDSHGGQFRQTISSDTSPSYIGTSPSRLSVMQPSPLADITNTSPTRNRHETTSTPNTSRAKYRDGYNNESQTASSPPIFESNSRARSQRNNPPDFTSHIVYLSPAIAAYKHIHALLPLVTPHDPVSSIAHFSRDLLRELAAPHMGPVVSESQAFGSLQKAALVESCLLKEVKSITRQLCELDLAPEETIEIWDWRVLEIVVAESSEDSDLKRWRSDETIESLEESSDGFVELVRRNGCKAEWRRLRIGNVSFDHQRNGNIFEVNPLFAHGLDVGKLLQSSHSIRS